VHFDPVANMQLLVSGLAIGSIYALVALGFVLIYNAVGVVNFAQGEFVMFPSYIAVTFLLPATAVFGTIVHWQLPVLAVYFLVLLLMVGFGLLFNRIAYHPLRDREVLKRRHEAVACLLDTAADIHKVLRGFSDVERITARVALKSARPRELTGLRESLALLPEVRAALSRSQSATLLQQTATDLASPEECIALLQRALKDEPAARLVDGGVIADGYNAELDELRAIQNDCGAFLLDMEKRERERTGLPALKVGYNRVQGFFIEIARRDAHDGSSPS